MLTHVSCYKEKGNWYMSLKYEFQDKDGTHRIIIPKLDFPQSLSKDPKIGLAFKVNELLLTHPASVMDPVTKETFVDDLLEVISRKGWYACTK